MAWLVLGAGLLAAIILAASFLANAPPKTLLRALKWIGIGAAVIVAAFLIVTGRAAFLLPLVLFGMPVVRRWLRGGAARRFSFPGAAPSPGGASEVETATLRMALDHDSGTIDGDVIGGAFAGRNFASLGFSDLMALLAECRGGDAESAPLVEAYLDRAHPQWRAEAGEEPADQEGQGGRGGYETPMDAKEALEILELESGAGADEVKEAHHRLMKKLHPDQGGSTYLATKINQAKDILLGS